MSGSQGSAGGQANVMIGQLTARLSVAELLIAGGAAVELLTEVLGWLPGATSPGGWPRALSIALLAMVFMRRWRGMSFAPGWYDYLLVFLGLVCGFFGMDGLLALGAVGGLAGSALDVLLEAVADIALVVIGIGALLVAWRGTEKPARS